MSKGKVAIVGTGYVGLPVAVLAKEKGWDVVGYEINAERVQAINEQRCPWKDEALDTALKQYPIQNSTDPANTKDADVVVVTVPTPVTGENLPDLTPLNQSLNDILPYLKPKAVLIIESTIDPGVMNEVVVPLVAQRADLPLDAHHPEGTFVIAHCPERINPGDTKWTIRNIPRVIGGYSKQGTARAKAFYDSILEAPVMVMNTVTEAESVKILENTFRDINIAFVNEMAKSFAKLGIDVMSVIRGASTKPFAFLPHYPGNGVGGHCISVDPYYMIERGRQVGFQHPFLRLARKINDSMPAYTVSLLAQGLRELKLSKKKATIALLGLAYKRNISDTRNSPALTIKKILEDKRYNLNIFDPYVEPLSTVKSLEQALDGAHAIMLATDHTRIVKALTPETLKRYNIQLLIDGKNALTPQEVTKAGIRYYGIGRVPTS